MPAGLEIHLVLDNFGTHKAPAALPSPLHAAEQFVAQPNRTLVRQNHRAVGRRRAFHSVVDREKATRQYLEINNQNPTPFVWTASADLILGKVESLCSRFNLSGH